LCAAFIAKESLFAHCIDVIHDAYAYCMDSPKRQESLREWQEMSGADTLKLLRIADVGLILQVST
jgi:hypothetical protein